MIFSAFGVCLAVTFAAMGWMSAIALRLDQARSRAAREAAQEENIRLALWRMDSALSPLIALESARSFSGSSSPLPSTPASWPWKTSGASDDEGRSAGEQDAAISRLQFQFDQRGRLNSPRTAGDAVAGDSSGPNPEASRLLAKLSNAVSRESVIRALEKENDRSPVISPSLLIATNPPEAGPLSQVQRSNIEWRNRAAQNVQINDQVRAINNFGGELTIPDAAIVDDGGPGADKQDGLDSSDWEASLMKPIWVNGELILARRLDADGGVIVQGCWVDWPKIKSRLLRDIKDLLPAADLVPAPPGSGTGLGRRLAALPLKLKPGPLPAIPEEVASPVRVALISAWIGIVIAAGAVAVLLLGAVSLSERRGAFVSAVTHELRTPLTTLRMYTEMLAGNMIKDEEQQRAYLQTLKTEAERLTHLVNNVLSYSRLEKGSARERIEQVSIKELLDAAFDRLAELSSHSGMRLEALIDEDVLARVVYVDAAAVERILVNLVDNACKYASAAPNRTIALEGKMADKFILLRVRDQGPGIDRKPARHLFRPFSKSARAAADSAPGVGLGLALSRQLARKMGGDLSLEIDGKPGACFTLALPSRKRGQRGCRKTPS